MKNIVYYRPSPYDYIHVDRPAFVRPLNHPDRENVSNTTTVRTSIVISIDQTSFETENSLYIAKYGN